MNIGRKIYYDKLTGIVLINTGERSGDVIQTTTEQDFQTYAVLSERVPQTVGCIQFEYGALSNEFVTCTGYRVDIETEQIIFSYTSPEEALEEIKNKQYEVISKACNKEILAGFNSTAKGGLEKHYDFTYEDQINLEALKNNVKDGSITEVEWKSSDELICTPWVTTEFLQLYSDAMNFKWNRIKKCHLLKVQISNSQTREEVEAVVW